MSERRSLAEEVLHKQRTLFCLDVVGIIAFMIVFFAVFFYLLVKI